MHITQEFMPFMHYHMICRHVVHCIEKFAIIIIILRWIGYVGAVCYTLIHPCSYTFYYTGILISWAIVVLIGKCHSIIMVAQFNIGGTLLSRFHYFLLKSKLQAHLPQSIPAFM